MNATTLPDCCPMCGHQFDDLDNLPVYCPVCREPVDRDTLIRDGDDYAWCQ